MPLPSSAVLRSSRKPLIVSFFGLIALLLLTRRYIWAGNLWPFHETGYAFQLFYTFYNEFFLHGSLARWLPFGTFGTPALPYSLNTLTPASYFVIAFGKILGLRDALLAFKLSLVLEDLIFLTGSYALARKLFKRNTTVLFFCLGQVLVTSWTGNIFRDFRTVYLIPFVFYFLIAFIKEGRRRFLVLFFVTAGFYFLGNPSVFPAAGARAGASIGSDYFGLIFGSFSPYEQSLYVGLLTLVFLLYALIRVRGKIFLVTMLVLLFFLALHTAHLSPLPVIAFIRMLLITVSAFGVEHYLNALSTGEKTERDAKRMFGVVGFSFLILMLVLERLNAHETLPMRVWPTYFYFAATLFSLALILLMGPNRSRTTGLILAAFYTLDLLSYQNLIVIRWPASKDMAAETGYVRSYEINEKRSSESPAETPVRASAERLIEKSSRQINAPAYAFLLEDPCLPRFGTDTWTQDLIRLYEDAGGHVAFGTVAHPDILLRVTSCGEPKWQLVKTIEPEKSSAFIPAAGRIHITSFTFNELAADVDVFDPEGAWFYYADQYRRGWKAWVGGQDTEIVKANFAFKAVRVPYGKHTVRWRYNGDRAGNIIFIAGITFMSAMLGYTLRFCVHSPHKRL